MKNLNRKVIKPPCTWALEVVDHGNWLDDITYKQNVKKCDINQLPPAKSDNGHGCIFH